MTTTNTSQQALLNEHDAARITGLSVASIRRFRLLKSGPRAVKINSSVRYRPTDIQDWLDSGPTIGGEPSGASK